MRFPIVLSMTLALAGCAASVPDSGSGVVDRGAGAGFGAYPSAREVALNSGNGVRVPPPVSTETRMLDDGDAQRAASEDRAAANSGVAPVEASPSNPAPQVVTNAAGISDEQDFDAVAEERDIAEDADLIARNRERFIVIEPTELPTRPGTDVPNIVEYALQTTNPVGTQLYRRLGFNTEARHRRNCAEFTSADLAQETFLMNGGPERDRQNLDPDGDGFACNWDPAPFRAVRGG